MTTLVASPRPFSRLTRTELRLFLRSPGSVLWTALLPVAALVALSLVPGLRRESAALGGLSYLDAYLPILMAFSLCMAGVNLLPASLATYREKGILRRLSTTPVPPSRLLGAQTLIYGAVGLATSVVMYVVAAGLGIAAPRQVGGFVLMLVLIAAATLGLGVLVAAVAPSAGIANGIGFALFFPLMFLAGLWVPRAAMPDWLRSVSDLSPLGAGVQGLQSAIAGDWPSLQPVLVLVAWALISWACATRLFRWE